jgi:hypothetical protein
MPVYVYEGCGELNGTRIRDKGFIRKQAIAQKRRSVVYTVNLDIDMPPYKPPPKVQFFCHKCSQDACGTPTSSATFVALIDPRLVAH